MTKKTKKNIKIKNSKKLGKLPIWNLSDLYDSPNNKNIKSDLVFIKLGLIALRYNKVKIPKNENAKKLKKRNFFRIELDSRKLIFIN